MKRSESASQGTQVLRLLHRQRVVHLLRTSGPLARADLADKLGLARSSITAIVGELIDNGTLVELESRNETPGARGRPRILLGCNPRAQRVVGIWIDERRACIVVADAAGNVSGEGQTATGRRNPASVIRSIIAQATRLISDSTGGPVAAAGVCIPGFVDGLTGVVVESNVLGWSKVDLGGPISRALGVPTVVQDTTQAITLAEAVAGQARDVRSAVVLDYGRRVGVGLVFDGRPYAGATGVAGTVGHIPAFGSSAQCPCGRIGCVDASMSLLAMQDAAPHTRGVPVEEIDLEAVVQKAKRTPKSRRLIGEVIDRIAHTAMLIEALIDPEVLVLAGLVVEFEELIAALEARINEIRPPERRGRTITVRSQISRMNAPKDTTAIHRVAILVAMQQLDSDIAGLFRMT